MNNYNANAAPLNRIKKDFEPQEVDQSQAERKKIRAGIDDELAEKVKIQILEACNHIPGNLHSRKDMDNKNNRKKLIADQKRQKYIEQHDGNFSEDDTAEGKAYENSNLTSQIKQSHYKESRLANQKDKGKFHPQDRGEIFM